MTTPHDSSDAEAQDHHLRRIGTEYGDQSSPYWTFYESEAETDDRKSVEALKDDMTLILIVNVLFSTIIATFIVATYQSLRPDNNQEIVCQLSLVSQGNTRQSSPFCPGPYPGVPSTAVVRSNILLFLSFFLVMTTVLACVLIQQWCREFMQYAYLRAAPHKRGRVRTYLFCGLRGFHIRGLIHVIHMVMQVSVFIFFCGISDLLQNVYPTLGMTSWCCTIALAVMYMALSISPLVISNSPYKTALTLPLLFGGGLLRFLVRIIWWYLRGSSKESFPPREDLFFSKKRFLVEKANAKAEELDPYAMKQLFIHHNLRDADMDKFLEGLPGYIHSHLTDPKALSKALTAHHILLRIREHLLTCVTVTELSDEVRIIRASACAKSLGAILQHPTLTSADIPDEVSLQKCVLGIVDDLNTLCEEPDETVNLRAFCVRALAVQGFLTECLEPANMRSPNQFPSPFQPLYTFLSLEQHDTVAQRVGGLEEMWKTVLYDGPLNNLTFLASKIILRGDADRSDLSLCWKTFDKLRSQLRIDRVDVSAPSSTLFDEEHQKARVLIGDEEPDSDVAPLLEVLDAVAGGWRLSWVFLGDSKYHNKADLVFGKDRLQNPDLFRAFAKCLPEFVTKHPEKSIMEFMEGLVCYDHLWTSLQVNLLNSLRSNAFIPAKLRVFERCCTVIDAAFASLENSPNVDWRSPELGSLAHYFELFVTDCFQGMFIERAIGFRVGLIKARFCKAVLTQFLDEFNRVGTVLFRSYWDVASLARVFYSLGVGTDEDVEFWKLFVDGGSIGAEFVAKTHTMLETAARDGPLLNFCKLGHLGMMAVPFEGSNLRDTDFEKLLDLLQKMTEDQRLTLASTPVWEYLGQLRDRVIDLFVKSSNEDNENMQDLLTKIDVIYHPNGHVQSQASETSAIVQPNPPFGGSMSANGITPAPFNNSSSRFPNLYSNPYPLLPSQSGPGGVAAHTFSASLLPTPSPYMRRNEQDRHALVYYPPGDRRR